MAAITIHDALTGQTIEREMTEEEKNNYEAMCASHNDAPGEQNASLVVEEEVTDVSVADSGGGDSADESPSGV